MIAPLTSVARSKSVCGHGNVFLEICLTIFSYLEHIERVCVSQKKVCVSKKSFNNKRQDFSFCIFSDSMWSTYDSELRCDSRDAM